VAVAVRVTRHRRLVPLARVVEVCLGTGLRNLSVRRAQMVNWGRLNAILVHVETLLLQSGDHGLHFVVLLQDPVQSFRVVSELLALEHTLNLVRDCVKVLLFENFEIRFQVLVLATKRVHIALVNILVTGHQTHCVLIELELLLTAQILVALARVLVLD
jgi:hypothetical protein